METLNTNLETRWWYDAFSVTAIGVAIETLNGQLVFANPSLCRMLGYSEEELLRKRCVAFSPVEQAKREWALFGQLKSGSIDHFQIDKRYTRRDGSLVWGRLTVSLIKTVNAPLVLAIVDDISARRLAESSLEEYEKAVSALMK